MSETWRIQQFPMQIVETNVLEGYTNLFESHEL